MVAPAAGAVVLVHFPFSDLSRSKLRPAIAVADAGLGDWILCQITSQPYTDSRAVEIINTDLHSGSLRKQSYARPGKLFTASAGIMARRIGELTTEKHREIVAAIVSLLQNNI